MSHTLISHPSRRQFLSAAGGTVIALPLLGWSADIAHAAPDEVPLDKLLAPTEGLPNLAMGNKDAKVTIVEYASMTCPACANFHNATFPKLKEKYIDTGKVYFVMREFPLNQLAAAVSMLARCVGEDKTLPFISVLFKTQDQWRSQTPIPKLQEISKQAGLTKAEFEKCLDNREMLEALVKQRDKASNEFGVNATPSFFINGKLMKTGYGIENFDTLLEPLLKG